MFSGSTINLKFEVKKLFVDKRDEVSFYVSYVGPDGRLVSSHLPSGLGSVSGVTNPGTACGRYTQGACGGRDVAVVVSGLFSFGARVPRVPLAHDNRCLPSKDFTFRWGVPPGAGRPAPRGFYESKECALRSPESTRGPGVGSVA